MARAAGVAPPRHKPKRCSAIFNRRLADRGSPIVLQPDIASRWMLDHGVEGFKSRSWPSVKNHDLTGLITVHTTPDFASR
jgi:hypothetical protein